MAGEKFSQELQAVVSDEGEELTMMNTMRMLRVTLPDDEYDLDEYDLDEYDITWANPRLHPLTAKMLQAVVVMKEGLLPRKVAVHS